MCGIAGRVDLDAATAEPDLRSGAAAMAAHLRHRGPDDAGQWVDAQRGVALGFRRLAVLDLSPRGAQPLTSSCGRYVVVFNGEVYNDAHLRARLQAQGRVFRGRSDTEVLAEAISAWGLRTALERADAMLALAVWDRQEGRLHLARDRFGEKPLYRARVGRDVLFASELTALRGHPGFRPELAPAAAAAVLRRGYVPGPAAALVGVSKVPPGTLSTLTADGSWRDEPYWVAADAAAAAAGSRRAVSAEQAADELEALLTASVLRRSRSDVPVGAFLSGGVDSSCVVALLQRHTAVPVRTYTIGFASASHDEAAHARAVAQALGTEHVEHYVGEDEVAALAPELPGRYDEPFADSSALPTTLVARLARQDVTVAFAGDGADELFGGYNRHVAQARLAALARLPGAVRTGVAGLLGQVPAAGWERVAGLLPRHRRPRHVADKAAKALSVLGAADVVGVHDRLLSAEAAAAVYAGPPTQPLRAGIPPGLLAVATSAEQLMWLDTVTYLPDDILTKVDRAAMSVSLETRLPYLEPDLFAYAWSLPPALRVSGGRGKRVLRDVLHRHVPPALVDRPKTGFAAPLGGWLRGPLLGWVEELLADTALSAAAHVDRHAALRIWQTHRAGAADLSRDLWHVLALLAWADTALLGGTVRPAPSGTTPACGPGPSPAAPG